MSFGHDLTGGTAVITTVDETGYERVREPFSPQYDFQHIKKVIEEGVTDKIALYQGIQSILQRPPWSLNLSEDKLRETWEDLLVLQQQLHEHDRRLESWTRFKRLALREKLRHEYLSRILAQLQQELFGD